MKKLEYTNPFTFEKTIYEFDDFHYEITEIIQNALKNKLTDEKVLKPAIVAPIVTDSFGQKLITGVIKDRKDDELIGEKYRIIIEKINDK